MSSWLPTALHHRVCLCLEADPRDMVVVPWLLGRRRHTALAQGREGVRLGGSSALCWVWHTFNHPSLAYGHLMCRHNLIGCLRSRRSSRCSLCLDHHYRAVGVVVFHSYRRFCDIEEKFATKNVRAGPSPIKKIDGRLVRAVQHGAGRDRVDVVTSRRRASNHAVGVIEQGARALLRAFRDAAAASSERRPVGTRREGPVEAVGGRIGLLHDHVLIP